MSTVCCEVSPSATVTWWWTISLRRSLPITWDSEAPDGKAYSPALSRRAAPDIWAAAMNSGAERTTPACSRAAPISETPAPLRRTTSVSVPWRAAGPGML